MISLGILYLCKFELDILMARIHKKIINSELWRTLKIQSTVLWSAKLDVYSTHDTLTLWQKLKCTDNLIEYDTSILIE